MEKQSIEIKNITEIQPSKWSGGLTYQIFISPENATLKEGFSIRISSATIEAGESNFSDFSGYNRFLTILSGNIDIKHENGEWREINIHEPYYFDGGINTQSRSKVEVVDFNLIWKKEIVDISAEIIQNREYKNIEIEEKPVFLFSLNENSSVNYDNIEYSLKKWDYFCLRNVKEIKLKGDYILIKSPLIK